ncbi:MAG TPA: carbon-nitrogen hydrolase family protein, partial [Isosphaeraceae bacterium]
VRIAAVSAPLLLALADEVRAQDGRPTAGARAPDSPSTLKVAAVQSRSCRDLDENVAQIQGHIRRLAEAGVRVAVFPECALTGYFEDLVTMTTAERLAEAERRVADACREAGIYAVVGTPHRDGDRLYNSAVVIDPSGWIIERHHKIQLAERWPSPGDHLSAFKVEGVPCSIIICHDERYPELVRLPVLAGARVIVYISHESSVRQESKIGPYRAQIQARAVENTVYVVQANAPANDDLSGSHGRSRVIAPDGNLAHEASMFGEEVVTADLDLRKATAENARRSLVRGPLADWWREGVKRVRVIKEETGDDSQVSGR